MKSIILIIVAVSGYLGYEVSQWSGLATGIIASILIGSSFLILLGIGDDMSVHHRMRLKQSIGGGITLIFSSLSVYIGGWDYGWLWVIPGYAAGVFVGIVISKSTSDDIKEDSNRMINSFKLNAVENLGYNPDSASIEFLNKNPDLSALLWEMLGDAGANVSLGIQDTNWAKQCDYIYNTFVQDENFKKSKPGAHALFRYAVYLCDPPNRNKRCTHPAYDKLE